MREYKFRVYTPQFGISEGCSIWALQIMDAEGLTDMNQVKIMQFTGLHDKNGAEIYEGDILKSNWGAIGTVTYGIYHDNGDLDGPTDFIGYFITWRDETKSNDDFAKYKVIGNIFEGVQE